MGYYQALEAAGATVHEFAQFGSYQGDWWALVTIGDRTGWIHGYYGSCSGCDAFEAEFGWSIGHEHGQEYISSYNLESLTPDNCEKCAAIRDRLVEFGKGYLDDMFTQEEAEAKASSNLGWDLDAKEMVEFIRQHAGKAA